MFPKGRADTASAARTASICDPLAGRYGGPALANAFRRKPISRRKDLSAASSSHRQGVAQ
jgi:hypothetical protein